MSIFFVEMKEYDMKKEVAKGIEHGIGILCSANDVNAAKEELGEFLQSTSFEFEVPKGFNRVEAQEEIKKLRDHSKKLEERLVDIEKVSSKLEKDINSTQAEVNRNVHVKHIW